MEMDHTDPWDGAVMGRETGVALCAAGVAVLALLYALCSVTAARVSHKGNEARLDGTWDQYCTQLGGFILGDPCTASRICRENRFNDSVETWLVTGGQSGN